MDKVRKLVVGRDPVERETLDGWEAVTEWVHDQVEGK